MEFLLMFFAAAAAFILFCVVASKVYPHFKHQAPVASEQELVGVGPEATKVDKDPSTLQG